MSAERHEPTPHGRSFAGLHAAELPCENCDAVTMHRIVQVGRERRTADGRVVEGTARCSQCRWTHAFRLELPGQLVLPTVVSIGARSTRMQLRVSPPQRLLVGSRVPGQDPPLRIVRIDLRSGKRSNEGVAREIATLWVTPDVPRPIPVSLILGARTAATRTELPPDQVIAVGETVSVAGGLLRVVGLRARGRTWSHPGAHFKAREVERIYTRRTESPPAGANRWSTSRGSPSSRMISTSRSERSRSSPGVRSRRSRPRARNASGGAVVHRDSPS